MSVKALTEDKLAAADTVSAGLALFTAAICDWIKSLPPEVIDEYNLHIAE